MKLRELVSLYENYIVLSKTEVSDEQLDMDMNKFYVKKISDNRFKVVGYVGDSKFKMIVRKGSK